MAMDRFTVTYRIKAGSAAEAAQRAGGIALEQTVEIPRDIVPPGFVEDTILGRVEEVSEVAPGTHAARVSYSPESCGAEIAQLLNVIFGNTSMQQGIKACALDTGTVIADRFPGARFGAAGIRTRCGRPSGGLIVAVLKPQGLATTELARLATACALAGADMVKDDHGLTDQDMAPFSDRVRVIGTAVAEANARTGGRTLYLPNLAGHRADLEAHAALARAHGCGGVLVIPGLYGFDLIHRLATDPDFNLPIMAHPAFLGAHVLSADHGLTHGLLFGTFMRLAGADVSIFPNVGGRFGFSAADCQEIATSCRDPGGVGPPIMPSPGGGMSREHAARMQAMYGPDTAFLLGGSLLRAGARIGDEIKAMREALDRAAQEVTP